MPTDEQFSGTESKWGRNSRGESKVRMPDGRHSTRVVHGFGIGDTTFDYVVIAGQRWYLKKD